MSKTGMIHSFESFGTLDGPGIRFLVFFQGCPLRCAFCHNPDTWDIKNGKEMTAAEVAGRIFEYESFIKNGGVTLTGGEPLMQPEFAEEILDLCKQKGFHTAIDTSGGIHLSIAQNVIDKADLILLDIKAIDEEDCLNLTGRTGQYAKDILEYCEAAGKDVWIRHVLVPGYTLDKNKLLSLAKYLNRFSCVKKVELLPFHKMGEFKWEELGVNYNLKTTPAPTQVEINEAKDIFQKIGLDVK